MNYKALINGTHIRCDTSDQGFYATKLPVEEALICNELLQLLLLYQGFTNQETDRDSKNYLNNIKGHKGKHT